MGRYNVWVNGPNGQRRYKISADSYREVRNKATYALRVREKVTAINRTS